MKVIALSLTLGFFFVIFAHGQESRKYLKLKADYTHREGYIINNDSLIIKGLIKDGYLEETKPYSIVNFVDIHGTKEKYHPRDLKGFGYSMMSFVSDGESFYQVVHSGSRMSLYKNVSASISIHPSMPGTVPMVHGIIHDNLFVKRPGEKSYKMVTKEKFAEVFSEYFADCESLKSGILDKKLTHEDMRFIVLRYNQCD